MDINHLVELFTLDYYYFRCLSTSSRMITIVKCLQIFYCDYIFPIYLAPNENISLCRFLGKVGTAGDDDNRQPAGTAAGGCLHW